MTATPDIDLGPLRGDDPAARRDTLAQLYRACTETGFFYAANSGVPDDLIARVYRQSAAFHALPDTPEKRRLHKHRTPYARGWVPPGEEPAYEAGTVSRCASFDLARELPPHPVRGRYANLGPNLWPDLPGFRDDVYGYYLACNALGQTLFRAFAEMLELEENCFAGRSTDQAPSTMRLLYYPASPAPLSANQRGISAHTDYECFTLMQQNAPGLQLQDRQGRWVDAPVRSRRFIVILGDMLERWTNGLLRATPHRVVDTPCERYSLILFCACDRDVVVEPLAPFVSAERPARYRPVTQHGHMNQELLQAEANREAAAG